MPFASDQLLSQYYEPQSNGPVMQCIPNLPVVLPATIAASGTYDSGVLPSDGYKVIAIGATLSQAGSVTITRYLDRAGTILAATPTVQALVAATPAVATTNDNAPFCSWRFVISNTGGSTGNLSGVAVLMNAI